LKIRSGVDKRDLNTRAPRMDTEPFSNPISQQLKCRL